MLYLLDGEERMKYCDFVKKVRKQLNYTQKELANLLIYQTWNIDF